jgi:hypothetical protein
MSTLVEYITSNEKGQVEQRTHIDLRERHIIENCQGGESPSSDYAPTRKSNRPYLRRSVAAPQVQGQATSQQSRLVLVEGLGLGPQVQGRGGPAHSAF